MQTENFTINRRPGWTFQGAITVEIFCDPLAAIPIKLGLAVRAAFKRGADLSGADLSGAPKIENIHQAVYAAASQPGALNMRDWHTCDTTHCRAGWAVALAGEAGKALEDEIGTPAAATLIYLASDPDFGKFPDFYCGNEAALTDMKARAEAERERASTPAPQPVNPEPGSVG